MTAVAVVVVVIVAFVYRGIRRRKVYKKALVTEKNDDEKQPKSFNSQTMAENPSYQSNVMAEINLSSFENEGAGDGEESL